MCRHSLLHTAVEAGHAILDLKLHCFVLGFVLLGELCQHGHDFISYGVVFELVSGFLVLLEVQCE